MDHLKAFLDAMQADAAVIHRPENIRYLSGYSGEGCLFVSRDIHAILTDFRYIEAAGRQAGVKYLFADFKKKNGYLRSLQLSKEYNLYRQDYCGCLYSKRED